MTALARSALADLVSYFDSWLAFRQRYDRLPGVQAAVLHKGQLLLSKAYGSADIENNVPLGTRHLFRVASHSKMFTATAVMQLVERGAIRLDDTAGRWLPFLSGAPVSTVTVRELLAHGGGIIRDGKDGDYWQLVFPFPGEAALRAILLDDADVLLPNERFKYSNIGYSILGLIIAEVSGQPYNDYVREHVINKLSLSNTGPEYEPTRAGEYATGYTALSYADRRIPIDHTPSAAMASATGAFSTAEDMVRFASAHFHGSTRLVSEASKRLMQRTEWLAEGTEMGYGLGLEIGVIGGRRVLRHHGGYPGHIAHTIFDPAEHLAASVMTSAIDGPSRELVSGLFRLVDLAQKPMSKENSDAYIDVDSFVGRFADLWQVLDIVALGGQLYALDPTRDDPADKPAPLAAVDDQTLRIDGDWGFGSFGETVRYARSADSVESIRFGDMTAYPIERVESMIAGLDRVRRGTW